MELQLLRNKDIYPNNDVLKDELKDIYNLFEQFEQIITKPPFDLELIWNYYNDGKAWLGKVMNKKKTVFWLSIWDGHFKTSFFFTEKNEGGIINLNIDEKIKKEYFNGNFNGKLRALVINAKNQKDIENILEIIKYKKTLK